MEQTFKIISPIDSSVYYEGRLHNSNDIENALKLAEKAQAAWKDTPLSQRKNYISKFAEAFKSNEKRICEELTWQMGRPIKYSPSEVRGTIERTLGMLDLAEVSLTDIFVGEKEGFNRYIKREPLGIVFVVPAWNYPYLIAINSIVPALLAGNAVVLRHSAQTPLVAERFFDAFKQAGLPEGLFQYLHLSHEDTSKVILDQRVNFVAFTGSVKGGYDIQKVAANRFIGVGLELGGKDPAYVMPDADLNYAVENLVDGSFFNSGQSCCGIERIYVHESVYDKFVEGFVDLTKTYKLGNPLDPETTLGPLAKRSGAELVREHIKQAIDAGAKAMIDGSLFPYAKENTNYLAPQVLIDVNHKMNVMYDETFGPVVGIMKVKNDEEALTLMNDSPYGLTASIWTENEPAAVKIGNQVNTGTWFMNRCDYLDPFLSWVGVKDSGRGCSLSKVGYEQLTRPKSYHLKIKH
ncbi:MAG: aldehyde dehydrogenase family protein [Ignavibacteriae bacterium]|nr:aldehyde dehydrogenase family protein [Ignavibacteriota bacterium]